MKSAFWLVLLSFILSSTLSLVATHARADDAQTGLLPLAPSLIDELSAPVTAPERGPISAANLNITVPYAPIREIFEQVRKIFHLTGLRNRGEAHITVITPPEFNGVLSQAFSPDELMDLMQSAGLEQSRIEPVCLGQGSVQIGGKLQRTFFVVVRSPDLIRIREIVRARLLSKGLDASAFEPSRFFPHITVGFTTRDLHESDNVIKNVNACDPAVAQL